MSKIKLILLCLFALAIVAAFVLQNFWQILDNLWLFRDQDEANSYFHQMNTFLDQLYRESYLTELYQETYSSDPQVRGLAAGLLASKGRLGTVDRAPAINLLQSDPSDRVKILVSSSLSRIISQAIESERTRLQLLSVLLESMTEDGSARVRDYVSYDLGDVLYGISRNKENAKFRIKAFELARPFFDKALKDKDKRVRDNARRALGIMHGNTGKVEADNQQ